MSDSKLVDKTILTTHYGYSGETKPRGGTKIDKIFVHHMAGNLTIEQCGSVFKNREASAHYGIGADGRVGQYVLEQNAAWHCGNKAYNQRSISIECANDGGASSNWHVSDKTISKLVLLLADICIRNGIKKLNYTGDLKGNLCMHCWTQATACPGGYLKGKFKSIADQVNKKIAGADPEPVKKEIYRVRAAWNQPKTQAGAFNVLANAKKLADELGLNVYDSVGKLVYAGIPNDQLYRVRKTWSDAASQVGAFKALVNAKAQCNKYPGYSVFDSSGKKIYTSPTETVQSKICNWAKKTAVLNQYHYKSWESNDEKTKQCPICHNLTGKYKGWNCIGFAFACWRHGGGIKCNCSCSVISDPKWNAILKASDSEALKIAQDRIGIKTVKVIRNNGKVISNSMLQAGDIVSFYKGSSYYHTALYVGNGQVCDITSSRSPAIKYGVPNYDGLKVAIRYTGK